MGLGTRGTRPALLTALAPAAVPRARPSATFGFNPCVNTGCGKPAVRPLVDTGAMVFVVFGILGINRTHQLDNHVLGEPVRWPPAQPLTTQTDGMLESPVQAPMLRQG